jgi:hypothetical protein
VFYLYLYLYLQSPFPSGRFMHTDALSDPVDPTARPVLDLALAWWPLKNVQPDPGRHVPLYYGCHFADVNKYVYVPYAATSLLTAGDRAAIRSVAAGWLDIQLPFQ